MESVVFMKESTPEIHKKDAKKSFSFALITISTSRYEKYGDSALPEEAEDLSGKAMKDLLEAAGHKVSFYRLVSDEKTSIADAVFAALGQFRRYYNYQRRYGACSKRPYNRVHNPSF